MLSTTLPSNVYNTLKWVVTILLPAVSALYFGLSEIYEWDNAAQVVGTLALVTTFLGVVIGISSHNFNTNVQPTIGEITTSVNPETGKTVFNLDLSEDLDVEALPDAQVAKFTVVHE